MRRGPFRYLEGVSFPRKKKRKENPDCQQHPSPARPLPSPVLKLTHGMKTGTESDGFDVKTLFLL